MAGPYDRDSRQWFRSVAERLASNEGTENVVYFLSTDLDLGQEQATENERLILLGLGKHDFKSDQKLPIE